MDGLGEQHALHLVGQVFIDEPAYVRQASLLLGVVEVEVGISVVAVHVLMLAFGAPLVLEVDLDEHRLQRHVAAKRRR